MSCETAWPDSEMLAFDLETTGVDCFADVPVAFALVRVRAGLLVGTTAAYVDAGLEIPAAATAVHGITTAHVRAAGVPLATAVVFLAGELVAASSSGVPIVGMNLDYDLTMLDVLHRRIAGTGLLERGFRGPVLDALVLDRHLDKFRRGRRTLADLCAHYGVTLARAHDAAADARAAADVVSAMCRSYPELSVLSLEDLHALQGDWHREWTTSFTEWRRRMGMSPPDDMGGAWPIARSRSRPRTLLPTLRRRMAAWLRARVGGGTARAHRQRPATPVR